jgi:thioredoxin-related protein
MTDQLVQQQLVNIFCDGLSYDYLRLKILREYLKTAIELYRMKEQNIRKRLTLHNTDNVRSDAPIHEARHDKTPHFLAQTSGQTLILIRMKNQLK